VSTVFLVRHGRTAANASGILAGRRAGVRLDGRGERQATAAGKRLAGVPLQAIITSPLERTRQTADAIGAQHAAEIRIRRDADFIEADYGAWTGKKLHELAKEDLWSVVQEHPSAVVFPQGESMIAMQHRAVAAIRKWNRTYQDAYAVISHGDVIKAILADALGIHLDQFQRIVIDPGSISVIRYSERRPFVLATNELSGSLRRFVQRPRSSDAAVGGGAG
jgi:probable phosphomutase (TIGR03848 family)